MAKKDQLAYALAVAAGAATAATVVQYALQKREAEARLRVGSALIETTRGPVECAVIGSGPAVLVSHGSLGGYDQGLAIGRPLADARFTVVAVSRAGYLRTPLYTGATPEAQADAHAAILDALGIEHAAILGASGGGPSAVWFALRYPERCKALIMMCTVSQRFTPNTAQASPIFSTIMNAMRSDFAIWSLLSSVRLALPLLGALNPGIQRRVIDDPARREMFEGVLRSMFPASGRQIGLENDLLRIGHMRPIPFDQVATPTLVLHGQHDSLIPVAQAEYTATHIPGARLITFGDEADHGFFISHYDEVWPQAIAFLHSHLGNTGA